MPNTICAAEVAALLDEWLATTGVGSEPSVELVARTKTTAGALDGLNSYSDYDAIHNRLYAALNDALIRLQQDIEVAEHNSDEMLAWTRLRTETLPAVIRMALGADEMAPPESLLPLLESDSANQSDGAG